MARRRSARQDELATWSGSLHKSFRVLPIGAFGNEDLMAFLDGEEGELWESVHARLPYDPERARQAAEDDDEEEDANAGPDPKRYRDLRQVVENCGLLWEDESRRIHFTRFGRTLKRFMPYATERNIGLVAQHAALALNVCQLRNPTGAGQRFRSDVRVFPFRFIWEAMLKLDNRINSDELNRAVFATRNEEMLAEAIERIRSYRRSRNLSDLGEETVTGSKKNDRLIPIICLAAFGWTLINQKAGTGFYTVKPECVGYLRAALHVPVEHRHYDSVEEYVTRISRAACLPQDVR